MFHLCGSLLKPTDFNYVWHAKRSYRLFITVHKIKFLGQGFAFDRYLNIACSACKAETSMTLGLVQALLHLKVCRHNNTAYYYFVLTNRFHYVVIPSRFIVFNFPSNNRFNNDHRGFNKFMLKSVFFQKHVGNGHSLMKTHNACEQRGRPIFYGSACMKRDGWKLIIHRSFNELFVRFCMMRS